MEPGPHLARVWRRGAAASSRAHPHAPTHHSPCTDAGQVPVGAVVLFTLCKQCVPTVGNSENTPRSEQIEDSGLDCPSLLVVFHPVGGWLRPCLKSDPGLGPCTGSHYHGAPSFPARSPACPLCCCPGVAAARPASLQGSKAEPRPWGAHRCRSSTSTSRAWSWL